MLYYEMVCLEKWSQRAFLLAYIWLLQVFTNSDKAHVEEALWGFTRKRNGHGSEYSFLFSLCKMVTVKELGLGMMFLDWVASW